MSSPSHVQGSLAVPKSRRPAVSKSNDSCNILASKFLWGDLLERMALDKRIESALNYVLGQVRLYQIRSVEACRQVAQQEGARLRP